MQIIDGKKLRDEILGGIKKEVAALPFQPIFCDVMVGDDLASIQYVQTKKRAAEAVDLSFYQANFPYSITTESLIEEIKILNKVPNMCGIIVQLPLPASLNKRAVLNSIDPSLDVDCLGQVASEKFYHNYDEKNDLAYPTALSCLALLDSLNLDLQDKNIVVLGQGMLVGRPMAALLHYKNFSSVSVIDKAGEDLGLIKQADVIIFGIGNGKYIKGDMIKKGAILIDAGASESEGGIIGDVDLESVQDIAGYVSPVPGGVGPVTVAMLLKNVLQVAKKTLKQKHE